MFLLLRGRTVNVFKSLFFFLIARQADPIHSAKLVTTTVMVSRVRAPLDLSNGRTTLCAFAFLIMNNLISVEFDTN